MFPDHPHARAWKEVCSELQASAYARPSDRQCADDEFARYPGREQMVFWMVSDAHLLQWLADQNAVARKANWFAPQEP